MIALQCPVCKRIIRVRAGYGTCAHGGTIHDAKKPAVLVKVPDLEGAA